MKKILKLFVAGLKRLKHNWGLKLLSLFFGIILWSTVVSTTNPPVPMDAEIPLTINGLEELERKGLALVEPLSHYLSRSVKVSVDVNRDELKFYDEKNIKVHLDLSRIRTDGDHDVTLYATNPVGERRRISPQTMKVTVDKRESRLVPVEVIIKGDIPDRYYKGELKISPTSVQITGPQQVTRQIEKAQVSLDLNDQTDPINRTREYTLVDENNTAVDASALMSPSSSVALTMDIWPIKNYSIIGKDIILGEDKLPKGYKIESVEVVPESIAVTGPKEMLDNVEGISIGAIDVAGKSETIHEELDISVPEGLLLLSAEKVTVLVRISEELTDASFEQVPVKLINIPPGLTVKDFSLAADVTLRAPVNTAEGISASHVQLTIDLSGLEAGQHTLPVYAGISEEFRVASIKSSIEQVDVALVEK